MNDDPFMRFLGIDSDSDAFELLGLHEPVHEPIQIEQALHRRLQMVFNHPDGRSEEAETVRQALRNAAEELKKSSSHGAGAPSTPTKARARSQAVAPIFNLTAFDRLVLGVLVGCGGWNAQSRARLVALSSSYGVSVVGLMRVVKGLSEYARSGGPKLGVTEIASGRMFEAMDTGAPGAPLGKPLLDRAAESLAVELRRNGPLATVKLAIAFGVLTLIAAIVGLRLVLASDAKKEREQEQLNSVARGDERSPQSPTKSRPTGAVATAAAKARLAPFAKYPNFLGNGLPPEAIAAVDQCAGLSAQFDEIARKLSLTSEPSEAVVRNWVVSVQTIAQAWALIDSSTRRDVERAMFEALREAGDTPSLSDRLLQTLMPPPTLSQPMDLWRGCWASGTLATISNDASLPPVVVERARAQVELAIEQKATPELRFSEAARAWLNAQVPRMVASIEIDPATYEVWELWISAQRVLGRNEHYDQAIGRAIYEILATGTDLAQAGASVNVLGRLVTLLVEEANASSYQVARAWFESDKITSRDLWVFTTLLAMSDKSTWFPDRMVLPEDADQTHRWRIRDDLAGVWPNVDNSGAAEGSVGPASLAFNRDLVSEWNDLCNEIASETTEPTPESQLRKLIRLSRLSEAAQAIENQDDDQARQVIRELQGTTSQAAGGSSAAPAQQPTKVGQPIGHDGEWAAAYAQIGRNFEQRIDSLRSLRSTAGTDLGPIDAELFVRELYRGSPPDVRLVAQSVATEQFTAGPAVAMELVDQLPGAPTTESLSQMIQDLTGESLPRLREANWPVMARLALVRHAMRVRSESTTSLDSLTDALIHSYVERLRLLRRERVATAAPATPQDAAELLVHAWADRSAIASAASPVPESLAGLQRRQTIRLRLAEGPIQVFAVYQLSILDRLAYVTVADQPALRDSVIDVMRQASSERLRVPGILEQIAHIELSVVRMWRIRFNAPEHASTGAPQSAEES